MKELLQDSKETPPLAACGMVEEHLRMSPDRAAQQPPQPGLGWVQEHPGSRAKGTSLDGDETQRFGTPPSSPATSGHQNSAKPHSASRGAAHAPQGRTVDSALRRLSRRAWVWALRADPRMGRYLAPRALASVSATGAMPHLMLTTLPGLLTSTPSYQFFADSLSPPAWKLPRGGEAVLL